MRQFRDNAPTSAGARRIARWCLAAAIAWAAALLLPGLDAREAWLMLGLAMIVGLGSDLGPQGDRAMAAFTSNVAAILVGAGVLLLARLLLAL
jgi:hypothetical protein